MMFNDMLGNLTRPPAGKTISVSGENVFGKPGAGGMADPTPGAPPQDDVLAIGQVPDLQQPHPGREIGIGGKIRPWIFLESRKETAILDMDGPGMIRHIWIAFPPRLLRMLVLRMYWDHEELPSVQVPVGDFFCSAPGYYGEFQSLAVCVNAKNAMNCYWQMPFRKHARVTLEYLGDERTSHIYYTINLTQQEIPEDAAYFHASFRRTNPLKYGEDFVIADGIRGRGSFAGCYMTWQQNNEGWWGEGEVKMYLDGDKDFPSICGTGTEDYFCGAWSFGDRTYFSPYSGLICGGPSHVGDRHAMYRFHLADPLWFHSELKVTMQALGWRSEGRFLPLKDDLSAVAYWYQDEPHAKLPDLPDRNELEVI
ncbi:MAG: DUF2961 domain-containing protein [Lentisphaeria bacterium]|nr:DUF2961 domain-containing protein [Lentisphaeria bacterium]